MDQDVHTSIQIRPVLPEDAYGMTALLNELIVAGGTTALDQPLSIDQMQAWVTSALACGTAFAAVAPHGDLRGFQLLDVHRELPETWRDIATYIGPQHQGVGTGAALFAASLAQALKMGIPVINATVSAVNSSGLRFYRRLGFVPFDPAPGLVNGGAHDDCRVHMKYTITDVACRPELEGHDGACPAA